MNNIWQSIQIMIFLTVQSFPVSLHFLLHSNSLLSTLFSHTFNPFIPLCERPNFTPIQNRWNYSSAYFNH
jgi:hypothetical protein